MPVDLNSLLVTLIPVLGTALALWLNAGTRRAEARKTRAEAEKIEAEGTTLGKANEHDLGELMLDWTRDAREHAQRQQTRAEALEAKVTELRTEVYRWRRYATAAVRTLRQAGLAPPSPAAFGLEEDASH